MADNLQRSTGRSSEYKFDRGGMPAEMGPYIGIVVNNVDNTRQGRLQVWIEQFGATGTDGSPNLTDESTWRTVRYCSPFYGATKQSGTSGVGAYPGNRTSYGMWFTPPDLGTKVLCFFVGGDPTVGGYYIGCLPEDGMNHMIPAIGASSNYQPNNTAQQQSLQNTVLAPVTEVNDIDPKFIDNPRFFDQKKPVQSTVEAVLFQQGLNKDPIRGPIKSSSQRESPSNSYGISTPGKPIYQGGLNEKTIKKKLETGQVKLQDIAVIGRQGGHTFVMDDGDLEGNDTLVRIRTAKGHQITMSDDGDAFFITHANGQTWIELGKQGTVDVYSTNSINLRTQGVLNFHADKGINMYSGTNIKMKSKNNFMIESLDNFILNSGKASLISSKTFTGIRSDGTVALDSKMGSWKSKSMLNFQATLINLNGAQTVSVPVVKTMSDFKLADTQFVQGQGWTVKDGALETIVTRAPTHEPYPGHGKAANIKTDLNPVINTPTPIDTTAAAKYANVNNLPVTDGVLAESIITELNVGINVGKLASNQVTALTAQTTQYQATKYPSYDKDGIMLPGWVNDPVYIGPDLGSPERGVGNYGQSVESLVSTGFLKPGVLDLINSGVSPSTALNSASVWTGQLGVNNLLDYLDNSAIQTVTQVTLANAAYQGLINNGVITGNEDPRYIATFLQPATELGVDKVTQWLDGFADEATTNAIEIAARQGQYAIDFIDAYDAEIAAANSTPTPVDIVDATDRQAIDEAIAELIGDPKVPIPQYTDTTVAIKEDTTSVIQSDGTIKRVSVTQTFTGDNGTFRFAPGSNKG